MWWKMKESKKVVQAYRKEQQKDMPDRNEIDCSSLQRDSLQKELLGRPQIPAPTPH
jgi:hypothetical protein